MTEQIVGSDSVILVDWLDADGVRGAPRYQIRSFFEHRSKGGGVISMFKNFGANFV